MSPFVRLSACFIALMMAMGIGRFALTPQLPHLLSEGQIDLTAAGLIAAANYLGYFIGALDAMFARRPAQVKRRLLGGLWLCVLLTLASFCANGFWAHLLLRFGTGVASAWVLVMITALSQPLAVAANRPRLGALVFAGPGLGIFLTGLLALVSHLLQQTSATLWLIYAAVALVMLLVVTPLNGIGAVFTDTHAWVGLVIGLGLLGTGAAYLAYYFIVDAFGALAASAVTYIPPVVALLIGAWLGEPVTATSWVAAGLILAGVALVQLHARFAKPARCATLRTSSSTPN